jgi:hypothetical protein
LSDSDDDIVDQVRLGEGWQKGWPMT